NVSVTPEPVQDLTVSPRPPAAMAADAGHPIPGQKFCGGCGAPVVSTAVVCVKCGTGLGSPRNKGIAILLAVFLGSWTWLYTYKTDSTKFWIGLALEIVGAITTLVLIGFVILFGVWLWSIIDRATKSEDFYAQYPNAT
ncbi:MAG: hypothetical protein ACREN1_01600, partial [Candidatus Dormibacteria bacterium]